MVIPLDGSRKDDLALQVLAVQVSVSSGLLPLLIRHDGQGFDQGEEASKGKTSKAPSVRVKTLGEAVQVGEHNHFILKAGISNKRNRWMSTWSPDQVDATPVKSGQTEAHGCVDSPETKTLGHWNGSGRTYVP